MTVQQRGLDPRRMLEGSSVFATVLEAHTANHDDTGPVVAATVEVNGVLYERAIDQEQARKALRRHQLEDQICDALEAAGASAQVLSEYEGLLYGEVHRTEDDHLRSIGWMLVSHGQRELWRLVFAFMAREAWGAGFIIGDETLFLMGKATSAQPGYQGPPRP